MSRALKCIEIDFVETNIDELRLVQPGCLTTLTEDECIFRSSSGMKEMFFHLNSVHNLELTSSDSQYYVVKFDFGNGEYLTFKVKTDDYLNTVSKIRFFKTHSLVISERNNPAEHSSNTTTVLVCTFLFFITLGFLGEGKPEKRGGKQISPIKQDLQLPYRYIKTPINQASIKLGVSKNQGGNLVITTPEHEILFESSDGVSITYIDIEFNETSQCSQSESFDSVPLLKSLGIAVENLTLANKSLHYHLYYDHVNKLKINAQCSYDGGPLSVGFSSKYYMN